MSSNEEIQKIDADIQHKIFMSGFEAGAKHKLPSDLTVERMDKFDKELRDLATSISAFKTSITNSLIAFLLSLLASFIFIGVWVGTIQSKTENNKEDINEMKSFLIRIESKIDNISNK